MSTYATLQGDLTFPDKASYQKAIKRLKDGRWMNRRGHFLMETEEKFGGGPHTYDDSLSIFIPYGLHRNLTGIIDGFFKEIPGLKGQIIGTTTDGQLLGWVIVDGKTIEEQDLAKWWATQERMDLDPESTPPDVNTKPQEYIDWLAEVERCWHEEHE